MTAPRLPALTRWALVAVAVLAPLWFPDFLLFEICIVLAYGIAILGLNLLMGHAGQICLAQGALFGVGAYVTAMLNAHLYMPPLATLPLAALATGAIGIVIGLPALRLQGLQLAIITFGVAAAFPQILLKLKAITGGVSGLAVDQIATPGPLADRPELWLYAVCLAGAAVAALVVAELTRGDAGRALRAQRDNPVIAEALGVHLTRARLSAFAASSCLAGLGGGLLAILNGFVSPASFLAMVSVNIVIGSIVGGATSIAGAFVGALFIVFVPSWTSDINAALGDLIYGAVLIAMMMVARNGIAGLAARLAAALVGAATQSKPAPEIKGGKHATN
jgi:branched-chain amino acid transport system permease protein